MTAKRREKRISWKARFKHLESKAKITPCDGTFIHVIVVPGLGFGLFENAIDAAIRAARRQRGQKK